MINLGTAPWLCSDNFRNILLLKMCEQFTSLKSPNDTPKRKVKRKSVKIICCIAPAFPTYTPINCFFQTCTVLNHKDICFGFCFLTNHISSDILVPWTHCNMSSKGCPGKCLASSLISILFYFSNHKLSYLIKE